LSINILFFIETPNGVKVLALRVGIAFCEVPSFHITLQNAIFTCGLFFYFFLKKYWSTLFLIFFFILFLHLCLFLSFFIVEAYFVPRCKYCMSHQKPTWISCFWCGYCNIEQKKTNVCYRIICECCRLNTKDLMHILWLSCKYCTCDLLFLCEYCIEKLCLLRFYVLCINLQYIANS